MNKIILSIIIVLWLWNISYATETTWTINTWISTSWLDFNLPCNPASVSNWSVNSQTCIITCNSWYNISWTTCTKSSSWWGGGWGWSTAPTCWNTTLSTLAKSYFSTCNNVILKKIISWILPTWFELKDSWGKYLFEVEDDEEILDENWNIFLWKLLAPKRISNISAPKYKWNQVSLRALRIWAENGSILKFKKWAKLTFSYSWISSTIKPENIRIYSYNKKTWKYILQDLSRLVDENKKIISVNIFESHNEYILTNWLLWEEIWEVENNEKIFVDSEKHWAKKYIYNLYDKWVVDKNNDFFPNENMNRAEFTKTVMVAFNLWFSETWTTWFSDVPAWIWYEKYLIKAKELWIIGWYEGWDFWPSKKINRAEAIKIVILAWKISLKNTWNSKFPDVPSYAWYVKFITKANELWIVDWYKNWYFWPSDFVTRWQVTKIITKTLELIK